MPDFMLSAIAHVQLMPSMPLSSCPLVHGRWAAGEAAPSYDQLGPGVIQDISSVPLPRCPGSVGPAGAGFDFTCMPVMQTARGRRASAVCVRRTPDGGGDRAAGKGAKGSTAILGKG